jgi:hypothetical protein
MKSRPVAATHYFNRSPYEVLNELLADNWGWEFAIGNKRLGDPDFKNELPEFEIIAEYRPSLYDRKRRFAIYGRKLLF